MLCTTMRPVLDGGKQIVVGGGSALSTTISSGGLQAIAAGGIATSTTVDGGGQQTISAGGIANLTTVNSGGVEIVSAGAVANNTVVNSGGGLTVASGGTANQAVIGAQVDAVNGATFTPGIAPGGVVSIFGTGLSGSGKATTVDMDGTAMRLLFATPFQINAEVPLTMAPRVHILRVQSVYGSLQQSVTVSAVAPGIFLIGNPPVGAITNQNFNLVGPSNPLPRGQSLVIFATGLGAAAGFFRDTTATLGKAGDALTGDGAVCESM